MGQNPLDDGSFGEWHPVGLPMDLTGMVTRDGRPVPGALVELMHDDGEIFQEMYSSADGRFRFAVREGHWVVGISCSGIRRTKDVTLASEQPTGYVHFDLSAQS